MFTQVVTILEAFLHDGTEELYYAVLIEYDDGEDEEVDMPARKLKFVEAPFKDEGFMDRDSLQHHAHDGVDGTDGGKPKKNSDVPRRTEQSVTLARDSMKKRGPSGPRPSQGKKRDSAISEVK